MPPAFGYPRATCDSGKGGEDELCGIGSKDCRSATFLDFHGYPVLRERMLLAFPGRRARPSPARDQEGTDNQEMDK